jgi:hypothetical protein
MHEISFFQTKHALLFGKILDSTMAANQTISTYQNLVMPLDWSCHFLVGQVWAQTKHTLCSW